MPSALRDLAAQALRPLPLSVLARLMPNDPIAFYYHAVVERQLPHVRHLNTCKTPRQFECDLEFLSRNYLPISYDELQSGPPPERGSRPRVLVTFDDGLRECYEVARPLLLKHGIPAIFFVTTDFLDNRRLFYKHKVSLCIEEYSRRSRGDQLLARRDLAAILNTPIKRTSDVVAALKGLEARAETRLDAVCSRFGVDPDSFLRTAVPYLSSGEVVSLAADGFMIGAHSRCHAPLASLTQAEVEEDIVSSCALICALVARASVPYAFPFNGRGVSTALLRRVRANHAHVGHFFDTQGIGSDSVDVVNRIGVEGPRLHRAIDMATAIRRAYVGELKRVVLRTRRRAPLESAASTAIEP
jgi:peptidoglycan/xylan/chitin deacetylase (PgdA/CDA1 family)